MQPGTNMPQWFAGGKTAFTDFPDPASMEQKFGATGAEQMQLLLDFLHMAGARSYTGIKGQPPVAEASLSGASGEKQSIEE